MKNNLIKNENNNNVLKKANYNYREVEWDYQYLDNIGCKADTSKKINIYFVNNFYPDEDGEYDKIVYNCVDLFDSNDFPIILLNILNPGGSIYNTQLVMELLSPTKTINIYGAFRNNGIYKGEVIENEILSEFSDF